MKTRNMFLVLQKNCHSGETVLSFSGVGDLNRKWGFPLISEMRFKLWQSQRNAHLQSVWNWVASKQHQSHHTDNTHTLSAPSSVKHSHNEKTLTSSPVIYVQMPDNNKNEKSHLMILLQAPHTGVLPQSSGACCAACIMELRFCMGVGWAGCWCWVSTVLVRSGRKRSAKLGSVTQGGLLGAEEPDAASLGMGGGYNKEFILQH